MLNINGTLMNGEREIGIIDNGILSSYDEKLIPLFLKRTRNQEQEVRIHLVLTSESLKVYLTLKMT